MFFHAYPRVVDWDTLGDRTGGGWLVLRFRYRDRGEAVLRKCDVAIRRGERTLLEGPSGGGKSTLLSLIRVLSASVHDSR